MLLPDLVATNRSFNLATSPPKVQFAIQDVVSARFTGCAFPQPAPD